MAGAAAPSYLYLSPQRKGTTANKRLSDQSPGCFSNHRVDSSSSKSFSSRSLSKGILTIGKDSDDGKSGYQSIDRTPRGNCAEPWEVVGTVLLLGRASGGAGQRSCQLPGVELPTPPPTMTWLTVMMARVVTSPLTGLCMATVHSLVEVVGTVLLLGTVLGGGRPVKLSTPRREAPCFTTTEDLADSDVGKSGYQSIDRTL